MKCPECSLPVLWVAHAAGQLVLWGVFVNRFEDALARYRRRRVCSAEEAGELLGVSGRQFRRLCVRFDEERHRGASRSAHGSGCIGAAGAGVRAGANVRVVTGSRYADFTIRHFHEALIT